MEDADDIASRLLKAHDAGATIARVSDTIPGFDIPAAYRVSAAITAKRFARGEKPVGWKIGYTNRAVQQAYGVLHPIWGRMYDTTVTGLAPGAIAEYDIAHVAEPRIEPEITVRIVRSPEAGMGPAELIGCIDAVSHGCEIVTSVFRDWKGTATDSVAAGSLHARYFHGRFVPVDNSRDWLGALTDVEVTLARNGVVMDRGVGSDALDGPLHALSHFVRGLHETSGERLKPGEIVTTGTLTQALLVYPGETWTTEIGGLPLDGIRIAFR